MPGTVVQPTDPLHQGWCLFVCKRESKEFLLVCYSKVKVTVVVEFLMDSNRSWLLNKAIDPRGRSGEVTIGDLFSLVFTKWFIFLLPCAPTYFFFSPVGSCFKYNHKTKGSKISGERSHLTFCVPELHGLQCPPLVQRGVPSAQCLHRLF